MEERKNTLKQMLQKTKAPPYFCGSRKSSENKDRTL